VNDSFHGPFSVPTRPKSKIELIFSISEEFVALVSFLFSLLFYFLFSFLFYFSYYAHGIFPSWSNCSKVYIRFHALFVSDFVSVVAIVDVHHTFNELSLR
jgi:hypothetical protein